MKTRTALAALTLSTLALPLAGLAPASASHGGGGDVRTHGGCGGAAVWKLKVKPDNGRIEFEAEVDSNRSRPGLGLADQARRQRLREGDEHHPDGASGSFSVARRMSNLAGTDHFTFRAVRRATGDVCRGTISL